MDELSGCLGFLEVCRFSPISLRVLSVLDFVTSGWSEAVENGCLSHYFGRVGLGRFLPLSPMSSPLVAMDSGEFSVFLL